MKRRFSSHLRVQRMHRTEHECAGVTLEVEEANSYTFESRATWPQTSCDAAIERGAREGLISAGYDPDWGVRIVVESILWDDGLSSSAAFEAAARDAIAGGPTELDRFITSIEELSAKDLKEDTYFTNGGPKFMRITFVPTGVSVIRRVERSSHSTRRKLMAELRAKVLAGERS